MFFYHLKFCFKVGRSVDETLRLVQAFQYTDKHGEGKIVNYAIF